MSRHINPSVQSLVGLSIYPLSYRGVNTSVLLSRMYRIIPGMASPLETRDHQTKTASTFLQFSAYICHKESCFLSLKHTALISSALNTAFISDSFYFARLHVLCMSPPLLHHFFCGPRGTNECSPSARGEMFTLPQWAVGDLLPAKNEAVRGQSCSRTALESCEHDIETYVSLLSILQEDFAFSTLVKTNTGRG